MCQVILEYYVDVGQPLLTTTFAYGIDRRYEDELILYTPSHAKSTMIVETEYPPV